MLIDLLEIAGFDYKVVRLLSHRNEYNIITKLIDGREDNVVSFNGPLPNPKSEGLKAKKVSLDILKKSIITSNVKTFSTEMK